MTYKLAFALVMLTLLLGLCGGCHAQGEVIPLTDDSDVDSDSDSEDTREPYIWMPRATCENDKWTFKAELREVKTDRVWVEIFDESRGYIAMVTLFPLHEMKDNNWYSEWNGGELGVYCNRDYWLSFVAENRYGSDRGYQKWTASE